MVDFQSRDTSRGLSDDEDPDDDGGDGEEGEEPEAGAERESGEPTADDAEQPSDATPGDDDGTVPDGESVDDTGGASADVMGGPTGRRTASADAAGSTAETTERDGSDPDTADTGDDEGRDGDDHRQRDDGHGGDDRRHDDHSRDDHGPDHAHDHSHHAHHHGPDVGQLGVAVVTVTSSRSLEDDSSGDAIAAFVEEADHEVVTRDVVADDHDGIQREVLGLTGRDDVDAVVTTGGTGVTPDDVTVDAVEPLFDKHLPGFGELFRILSYEEVGTRAISTRATAGISAGVPVFCLPGSENAVRLAMDELVVEEVAHLVGLARED